MGAEDTWAAIQGRQMLRSSGIRGPMHSSIALSSENSSPLRFARTPQPRVLEQAKRLRLYETPFLAHATMEPMNCTAHVQATHCEVWVPTQHPQAAQQVASTVSGLPLEAITVHVTLAGGGFGRRIETDFVVEAVQISKAIGAPPLPAGWGRGMAVCDYFSETVVAEVVEVSVASDYSVRVHRVVCAVDCGLVVNPSIAASQIKEQSSWD